MRCATKSRPHFDDEEPELREKGLGSGVQMSRQQMPMMMMMVVVVVMM